MRRKHNSLGSGRRALFEIPRSLGAGGNNSGFQHGVHRRHRRQRCAAGTADHPQRHRCGCAMGNRSLFTFTLGAPAGRRFAWRSLRTSPSFCDWGCPLRVSVGGVRIRGQHSSTHRGACTTRTWRSSPDSVSLLSAVRFQRTNADAPSAPGPVSARSQPHSAR